jgi:hypothetical protein
MDACMSRLDEPKIPASKGGGAGKRRGVRLLSLTIK